MRHLKPILSVATAQVACADLHLPPAPTSADLLTPILLALRPLLTNKESTHATIGETFSSMTLSPARIWKNLGAATVKVANVTTDQCVTHTSNANNVATWVPATKSSSKAVTLSPVRFKKILLDVTAMVVGAHHRLRQMRARLVAWDTPAMRPYLCLAGTLTVTPSKA